MKLEKYVVGMVATNCYFLIDWDTKHIIIVDPGAEGKRLAIRIREAGYIPEAVLLTHGHFDHAKDAEYLAKEFGIPVYAGVLEKDTLESPNMNLSIAFEGKGETYRADRYLKDQEVINLLGVDIKCLSTPGHTIGGCCFYVEAENLVFSGDTLFNGSVGRTDFPGGSMSALVRSVEEKLFVLPDSTKVYPGHDFESTIGQEKMYNPYF